MIYPTLFPISVANAASLADCTREYTIDDGDYCDKIAQDQLVSMCVFEPYVWFTYCWHFSCSNVVGSSIRTTLLFLKKVALTSRWTRPSALPPARRTARPFTLSKSAIQVKKSLPRMGWNCPLCVRTMDLTKITLSTLDRFVVFLFFYLPYFWLLYPCCGIQPLESGPKY